MVETEEKRNYSESGREIKRAKTDLTLRQQQFCNEYVSNGGNATAAYKAAYNSSNMLPATINRKAKTLMDTGKIRARIDQLTAPAAKKAALTVESHIEELSRLKEAAETAGHFTAAIRAEELRGKAVGFYLKDNNPRSDQPCKIIIRRISPREIKAEINNDDSGDVD